MTVYVQGENGVICGIWADDAVLPDGIAFRLGTGELTRVTKDGHPWAEDGADEPDAPPDAPELPKRSASRADWTEFAVSQGMERGDAAAMTRNELADHFTSED